SLTLSLTVPLAEPEEPPRASRVVQSTAPTSSKPSFSFQGPRSFWNWPPGMRLSRQSAVLLPLLSSAGSAPQQVGRAASSQAPAHSKVSGLQVKAHLLFWQLAVAPVRMRQSAFRQQPSLARL